MNKLLFTKSDNIKPAFTLAEMMVVMLLLSIVLAAGAPLMTKRTESTSLWRQTPNNANKIYYSTNDKQQVLVGTKNDNIKNSKLHINSSNPSSYPHLTFSVNGAYAGVINVESTSRMSVKLAASAGNTFALDNSNLYVNGNIDIGQAGTNYTLKLNGNEIRNSYVPIGTVIIWPGGSAPQAYQSDSGTWLLCNGQAIPTQYSVLRSIVGAYTPNYQGIFLRGCGTQYTDNWWGTTAYSSGGLGAIQYDAIRNITGGFNCTWNPAISADGAFYNQYNGSNEWTENWAGGRVYLNVSRVVPTTPSGGTSTIENRPVNKAVHYYIKAAH